MKHNVPLHEVIEKAVPTLATHEASVQMIIQGMERELKDVNSLSLSDGTTFVLEFTPKDLERHTEPDIVSILDKEVTFSAEYLPPHIRRVGMKGDGTPIFMCDRHCLMIIPGESVNPGHRCKVRV